MPLAARRVFRLSLAIGLTLAAAYGFAIPLPFVAPIFALVLTAKPGPALGLKALIGLLVLVMITMGVGLLMVPVLVRYPMVGLMLVAIGLYLSIDLSVNRGKGAVGTFLTVGLTLITAAGVMQFAAAQTVAEALMKGIFFAVVCQRIAHVVFPEGAVASPGPKPPAPDKSSSKWIAARTTLIVFPAYFLGLVNPTLYLPIILKAVSLGQQSTGMKARNAGRELLNSTFLGGCFAILFWFALKMEPNLFMFFMWTLLFGLYLSAKLYRVLETRFPPSFWINVVITMLILVGPAVADSASGKDVYKAFAVRMSLFVAVTVYAWAAVIILEQLRAWQAGRAGKIPSIPEVS